MGESFAEFMRNVHLAELGLNELPYTDILESLNHMDEKLKNQQSPIDWSFVRAHLGSMQILKKYSDFSYDVFSFLRYLYDRYQCRDFSVIADVFQLQCFIFEYSSSSFRMAKRMTGLLKNNISCIETDGLNFVANLMRAPYKSNCLPFELMNDVIQMHVISVEDKLLKELLEYGIMYIHLGDHRLTWGHCRQRMSILLETAEKSMLLNTRTFCANVKQLSCESRQRMLAVFRGIEVILKARIKYAIDFGLCFRMAYETIPEPVITKQEVVAFLKLVLSGRSADTLIQSIADDYGKLFPESLEPRTPRKLKHLSRCQVRQNLRQAGSYPFGICDLPIPTATKNEIHTVINKYMLEQYNSYHK